MPKPAGWVFRGQSTMATGTTGLTVNVTTAIQDNDLMVLVFAHHGTTWGTMPAGWTMLHQEVTSGGFRLECHLRRASSEPSSYAITGLLGAARGQIVCYGGGLLSGTVADIVDTSTIRVNGTTDDGTDPITTTEPNALVFFAMARPATSVGSVLFGVRTNAVEPDLASVRTRNSGATTGSTPCALAYGDAIKIVPGSTLHDTSGCLTTGVEQIGLVIAFIPETEAETEGTRYYLAFKFPGLPRREPWFSKGDWNDGHDFVFPYLGMQKPLLLSQTKAGTGRLTHFAYGTNQQPNFSALIFTFLTPPLAAQTLGGTFDVAWAFYTQFIDNVSGVSPTAVAQYKLHVWVSDGQTNELRATLIDNYIDATDLPTAGFTWQALTSPQALPAIEIEEGDSIVIEIGVHLESCPEPFVGDSMFDPLFEWARFACIGLGASDALTSSEMAGVGVANDGVPGEAASTDNTFIKCPYFSFSQTIVESSTPLVDIPTNTTPSTALVAASLPYASDLYDTTRCPMPGRAVWHQFTAPETGTVLAALFGSSGSLSIQAYTGDPALWPLMTRVDDYEDSDRSGYRSLTASAIPVTVGETYYIRFYSRSLNFGGSAGGYVRLSLSYQREPEQDDVFVPSKAVCVYRDGVLVNWTPDFSNFSPTGIAIDYTEREMDDLNGGTHSAYRLILGLFFTSPLVEIVDATTLNRGDFEIDYISDVFFSEEVLSSCLAAALHVTPDGVLFVQHLGDGFLYAMGPASTSDATSFLNAPSSEPEYGSVRGIDATHGDNQASAPWPVGDVHLLEQGPTPGWHGGYDPDTGILYYSTGPMYLPLDGVLTVKRFNLLTDTQLSDLVTFDAFGSNPGVRGICVVPGYGIVATNGDRLHLVTFDGVVVRTYIPEPTHSIPTVLFDVRLTSDGLKFWALCNSTSDLFQFDLVTGEQLQYVETSLSNGVTMQIAIFQPGGITPPDLSTPDSVNLLERTIRRLRQAPHLSNEQRRMVYTQFQLDIQSGIGLTEGQGSNPRIFLSWSDDGGHTWSNEYPMPAGTFADYEKRVIWRRLGQSRDRIFRVTMSDPVDWVLLDAFLKFTPGGH